ncbi:MAG: dehydrogenase, partial [Pseudomonadales bacterium]|nr:dehydrogenase [Pseudomonadales bacterium]
EELAGKTLVTASISEQRLQQLHDKGVNMVIDYSPQPFTQQTIGIVVLEALIMAALGKQHDLLTDDDLLEIITDLNLEPRTLYPCGFKRTSRFAFVIHPLSQQYFRNQKPLDMISKVSPPIVMNTLERIIAYAPPFLYSRVKGIKSPTGAEAEGWLITVGGTPKEIMSHSPEFTYRRLLAAAEMAKKLGAQIMGLGAFTKVVGDAGITVAKRAPLPITTGNSYSASGTLWAAHDAIHKLGLVQMGASGKMAGKAMVVGATGSIGSVCARLLAKAAEETYLVAPEPAKLLALKEDIERETPGAIVHVMAHTHKHLREMDMIVTATSGAGKKILDIMEVKPGCVITDVARPLDIPPEDVAKRPDVLVIESGEIRLPGTVEMRNIGLPDNVVYACLAETIVLALEGRYENFTLGRNIEWKKVREIYKLGLKHGMQLASISGVNGVYSDDDLARIRALALEKRPELVGRGTDSNMVI